LLFDVMRRYGARTVRGAAINAIACGFLVTMLWINSGSTGGMVSAVLGSVVFVGFVLAFVDKARDARRALARVPEEELAPEGDGESSEIEESRASLHGIARSGPWRGRSISAERVGADWLVRVESDASDDVEPDGAEYELDTPGLRLVSAQWAMRWTSVA